MELAENEYSEEQEEKIIRFYVYLFAKNRNKLTTHNGFNYFTTNKRPHPKMWSFLEMNKN